MKTGFDKWLKSGSEWWVEYSIQVLREKQIILDK